MLYAPFLRSTPKTAPCWKMDNNISWGAVLLPLTLPSPIFEIHNCSKLVLGGEAPGLLTTLSASPTCLLVLTSRGVRKRERIAARCIMVNPSVVLPLTIANCYWSGSELDDSRLRCR